MTTAFELLSKVKLDGRENQNDYILAYFDGAKNTNIEIPLSEVKFINQLAFMIRVRNEDVEIPMHRLRKIYKRGLLLWQSGKVE